MNLITIDFETFWSQDYSVSRLTPLEYVKGDQFEVISCAFKLNDEPTRVVMGEDDISYLMKEITPEIADGLLVAHNMTAFDAYILAYHFGVRPRMWGDTLAMARSRHAKTTGLSLDKLVAHYGLGCKDQTALINTKGKHLAEFTEDERQRMAAYNAADTDQCHALFKRLLPHVSPAEMWQIDALVRMRTEPAFELDQASLQATLMRERKVKHDMLLKLAERLGVVQAATDEEAAEAVRTQLASAARFSELLNSLGAEAPTKPSPTHPDKVIPALAKTDPGMQELTEHENELVAASARARLDVKSTLLETRIEKFLTAARYAGGMLPIPLKYCGADTTGRDSGDEFNPQNLPRIDPSHPKASDALRHSLLAPGGKLVIVADQSGIELRVNHFLWKVQESMDLYRADPDKADLYKAFASHYYNKPAEQITKEERQFAKVCQLGLGFGASYETFQRVARFMGGMTITMDEAAAAVTAWRIRYRDIVAGWRLAGNALGEIAGFRASKSVDPWELVHTDKEGLRLPSGRLIHYPNLRQESGGRWSDGRPKYSWVYADGRHKTFISGNKVVENMVQALARDSLFDCTLEYYRRTGLRPALRVHDELVYVVDENRAEELLDELKKVMRTPPAWWPELVVSCEGGVGVSYGDAK